MWFTINNNAAMKTRKFDSLYITILKLFVQQKFDQKIFIKVAGGFSCPAAGEIANAGAFSRHAHPEDCRKYYICLEGVAREYGCPIGTVFKIGDADGTGNCEDPEDVPGCRNEFSYFFEDYYGDLDLKSIRKSELHAGLSSSSGNRHPVSKPATPKAKPAPSSRANAPSKPQHSQQSQAHSAEDN
ncbi:hypothetical protein B566_EDAN010229 [Ephemera danica]|nr:hypothetical protein B566_EDAN010229 [Ephemera danica]